MTLLTTDLALALTRAPFYRGRVALAEILRSLGVGKGDDVVIQAFTCIAVPEAVLAVGARPVYVDIEESGINMNPAQLESVCTPRTRAIVMQHTFGLPANVKAILKIAQARGIPVVEDCAHAIGSTVDGVPLGSWGAAAFFSFESGKPIIAGIGGCAIAADPALASQLADAAAAMSRPGLLEQLRIAAMAAAHDVLYRPAVYWPLRNTFRALSKAGIVRGNYTAALDPSRPARDFHLGMGGMQLRRLRSRIARLADVVAHRRRVAEEYRRRLTAPGLRHVAIAKEADPVFARYPLLVDNKPELIDRARRSRVELASFYDTPIHPLAGKDLEIVAYRVGQCPVAEATAMRIVHLPTDRTVSDSFISRAMSVLAS